MPAGIEGTGQAPIVIVSGLPRSGTSMMMRMLEAGGLPVLIDRIRRPDEDNPEGYYEYERVKKLEHDSAWLEEAKGSAVKMIAALLRYLPAEHTYKAIFMERNMSEILASQRRMLERRGEDSNRVSDAEMAEAFRGHLDRIKHWIGTQANMETLYLDYGEVLANPLGESRRIGVFLGMSLDVDSMVAVVDPTLYRQRRQELLD